MYDASKIMVLKVVPPFHNNTMGNVILNNMPNHSNNSNHSKMLYLLERMPANWLSFCMAAAFGWHGRALPVSS